MKGKYYKRDFSKGHYLIVIPLQDPKDVNSQFVSCKILKEVGSPITRHLSTQDLFHSKLIPMTEEEVLMEVL